jgi:D-alanine-D-alanine ligase
VRDEVVQELPALRPDVAFIALHGRFGEDGGVQRRCESYGIPYTGSAPTASALAMDKDASKRAFQAAGVPTASWRTIDPPFRPAAIAILLRAHAPGLPCVVKPTSDGSSIGVSIVRHESELAPALAVIERLGSPAIVEAYIPGREFTIGVLGEHPLPPIELVPQRTFYDFDAKYGAGSGTEYRVDPALPPDLRAALMALGLAAHRSLGCEGVSRTDIRMDGEGHLFVLEVNTIPGMTPRSLLPKAAAAIGIDYGALCEHLMTLALEKRPPPATSPSEAPQVVVPLPIGEAA